MSRLPVQGRFDAVLAVLPLQKSMICFVAAACAAPTSRLAAAVACPVPNEQSLDEEEPADEHVAQRGEQDDGRGAFRTRR